MFIGWFSRLDCHHTAIWIFVGTLIKSNLAVKYRTVTSTVILQEVCLSLSMYVHSEFKMINQGCQFCCDTSQWGGSLAWIGMSRFTPDVGWHTDTFRAHNFIWQLTFLFTQTNSYDGKQHSIHRYCNLLWVRSSHVSFTCDAVNIKFLFKILKNSAGNISLQLEEILHRSHMFIAHPCSILLVSHWDLTNNSCLSMCPPCIKLKENVIHISCVSSFCHSCFCAPCLLTFVQFIVRVWEVTPCTAVCFFFD